MNGLEIIQILGCMTQFSYRYATISRSFTLTETKGNLNLGFNGAVGTRLFIKSKSTSHRKVKIGNFWGFQNLKIVPAQPNLDPKFSSVTIPYPLRWKKLIEIGFIWKSLINFFFTKSVARSYKKESKNRERVLEMTILDSKAKCSKHCMEIPRLGWGSSLGIGR